MCKCCQWYRFLIPPQQEGKLHEKTSLWYDEWLMGEICKYWKINWKTTPLCNDRDLFYKLKKISHDRWVDFWLAIWVTYAESHIWINFKPQYCSKTNNRSWKKRAKFDDNTSSVRFNLRPDRIRWCWLYTFSSVEEFWKSHVNSLYYWYISKWCNTPECISRRRVKWDWITSPSWNERVSLFIKQ